MSQDVGLEMLRIWVKIERGKEKGEGEKGAKCWYIRDSYNKVKSPSRMKCIY